MFYKEIIDLIIDTYGEGNIPLHRPIFNGNEKKYLLEAIDSNFVSSVGARVNEFECSIEKYLGVKHAIATVNGTSALHISLLLASVGIGDEVLTQPLTFIGTINPIKYCGASPIFIDVDLQTLGMSHTALEQFLLKNVVISRGHAVNRITNRRIKACVPVHIYGMPCRINEIRRLCDLYNIIVIEDAAEAFGSSLNDKKLGTFGKMGILSFNGNKVITTGGGGMIVTNDTEIALQAKHITTTSKIPHKYIFEHDQIGYNYRMPNLNAALGCAQLEKIDFIIKEKRKIFDKYLKLCNKYNIKILHEYNGSKSNYWLNTIIFNSKNERDSFIIETNKLNIMTRPAWELINRLPMYRHCQRDELVNANYLVDRIANLPSSVPFYKL